MSEDQIITLKRAEQNLLLALKGVRERIAELETGQKASENQLKYRPCPVR